MQVSSTRLKKPLHIWLARIIGVGIVLASVGINLFSLPEVWKNIRHQGVVQDVYHSPGDIEGVSIVDLVSSEAAQKGVAIGDKVLNPEADSLGEIGTPVTLQIQRGNSPVREIKFARKPFDQIAWGAFLVGLPLETSTTIPLLNFLIPILMGGAAALLICWLKADDWMALLTAVMLANLVTIPNTSPYVVIFRVLTTTLFFSWFILFPSGELVPRWSWMLILLTLPSTIFYSLLDLGIFPRDVPMPGITVPLAILSTISLLGSLAIILFRYRRIFSPIERQQTKWIVVALSIGFLPIMIAALASLHYWGSHQIEKSMIVDFIASVIATLMMILIVLGILFSIFRYRLYDVDIFVSRALVYSALTGILAMVGFVTTVFLDYALKQTFGNQTGLLTAIASAVPIAALFNPVREQLQKVVDRRFKQEEMDFENTFIEFTSELSSLFTKEELSTHLSRHAVEQLDVAYASVFLNGPNGTLKPVNTTSVEAEPMQPALDDKIVEKIQNGQLVSPDGDSAQSLVVPLVVPRSRKPSLIGALILGRRLQGLGYSTTMLKSLKKFGEQVGKAFYIAEVKGNHKE